GLHEGNQARPRPRDRGAAPAYVNLPEGVAGGRVYAFSRRPELLAHRRGPLCGAAAGADRGAGTGESLRDGTTDAAAGTGNEGGLAPEHRFHARVSVACGG